MFTAGCRWSVNKLLGRRAGPTGRQQPIGLVAWARGAVVLHTQREHDGARQEMPGCSGPCWAPYPSSVSIHLHLVCRSSCWGPWGICDGDGLDTRTASLYPGTPSSWPPSPVQRGPAGSHQGQPIPSPVCRVMRGKQAPRARDRQISGGGESMAERLRLAVRSSRTCSSGCLPRH